MDIRNKNIVTMDFYITQIVLINEMYSLSLSYLDDHTKELFSLSIKEIEGKKNTYYGILIEKYGEEEALLIRRQANSAALDASMVCVQSILNDENYQEDEKI